MTEPTEPTNENESKDRDEPGASSDAPETAGAASHEAPEEAADARDEADEEAGGDDEESRDDDAEPIAARSKEKGAGQTAGQRLAAARAAKAAAKAAKRGRALVTEEKAVERAMKVANAVEPYRNRIVIAVAAVVLGVIGWYVWDRVSKSSGEAAGIQLLEAVRYADGRIETEAEMPRGDDTESESFPSSRARAEKALGAFRRVVTTYPTTAAARYARIGEARALLDLGRLPEARTAFQGALRAAQGDVEVQARSHEGLGFVAEATNDRATARTSFEALSRVGNGTYRDLAEYHLARLLVAEGQRDRAKTLLEGILRRRRATPTPSIPGALPQDPGGTLLDTQVELELTDIDPTAVPRRSQMDPAQLEQLRAAIQAQAQQAGGGRSPIQLPMPMPTPPPAP